MKKNIVLIFIVANFVACQSAENKNSDIKKDSTDTTAVATIMVPNTTCFRYIHDKDTVYLKIEKFPNVVTGKLVYNFFEKDGNTGDIDGKLQGDTLIADYTFKSEGQTSVRQVAFIVKDNMATEGNGDMEEKEGKMVFKNIATLDFSKGLQLNKIDCPVE